MAPPMRAVQKKLGGGHSKAHPGFSSVQSQISKGENISMKAAGAILAASSRHASKAAKQKNPRLKRVK
jgi:hypothetical protein